MEAIQELGLLSGTRRASVETDRLTAHVAHRERDSSLQLVERSAARGAETVGPRLVACKASLEARADHRAATGRVPHLVVSDCVFGESACEQQLLDVGVLSETSGAERRDFAERISTGMETRHRHFGSGGWLIKQVVEVRGA